MRCRPERNAPRILRVLAVLLALAGLAVPGAEGHEPEPGALHLERIEVRPAASGLEAAIGDLLGLRPGDAVDAADLRAARRRLQLSGWFERVEVYTERGRTRGGIVLRIDTELDMGVQVETGLLHDPLEGWAFELVGLRAHHVVGAASTATLGWQFGPRRSGLAGDLLLRRPAGAAFDLLVRLEAGQETWFAFDGENVFEQEIERGSLALGARLRHGGGLATTLWLRRSAAEPRRPEQVEGTRSDPPASLVGERTGREEYAGLGLDLTLDRRDLAQPWRRGIWATLGLRADRESGGERFSRAHVALRTALPLPREQALAWRLDARWSDPSTPYHLRPVFGGQGTVRGFRHAALSGGRGARSVLATSLEWRAPVLGRGTADARVHGALFVDTGTFVDADGITRDWATSVGWGLRVRLPWVERFSIDLAVPLTPTPTDDPFRVHGGLGFGF